MKVVHLGTVVQSQFGLLDDEGNIIQTWTVKPGEGNDPLNISKLAADAFSSAYSVIAQVKTDLQKKVDEENN